jgi:hypothetical protein
LQIFPSLENKTGSAFWHYIFYCFQEVLKLSRAYPGKGLIFSWISPPKGFCTFASFTPAEKQHPVIFILPV